MRSLHVGRILFFVGAMTTALVVSDRTVSAQLAAGEVAGAFSAAPFVTGATNVTDIAFLADGRAVITLKGGAIWVWKGEDNIKKNAGSLTVVQGNGEQGLLGVVALKSFREAPDGSEAQRTVFFYASVPNEDNPNRVYKGVVQADDTVVVSQTPITAGLAARANHNGGGLIVASDGLYVSVGDTGANSTPPQNKFTTCLNVPHGKILRINPDGSIPSDNPLSNETTVTSCTSATGAFGMDAPDKRIYAWGLRNAYRFWVDPMTKLLWVGDVGEGTREEVSVGGKGTHFGYPFEEGTVKYSQSWNNNSCMGVKPARACTPPQHEWNTVKNGPNCSIGGLIPDGDNGLLASNGKRLCGWPAAFKSRYFFGDHGSGDIWVADVKPDRSGLVKDTVKPFGKVSGLSGFRVGFGDSLYAVGHDSGSIVKISPKNYDAAACANQVPMNMGGAGGSMATGGSGGAVGNAGGSSGQGIGGSGGTSAGQGGGAPIGTGGLGSGEGGGGGTGTDEKGSDGCSCSLGYGATPPSASALLLGAFGLAAGWRRRRGRRSRCR